jgi:hypothetical protein
MHLQRIFVMCLLGNNYSYYIIYTYPHHCLPIVPLPVPVRPYHNTPHLPLLPDRLVHSILPIGPYSYINTCSLPPTILFFPKTLKMEQTSDPETLVIHQETTPGNNPEDFKQHHDHGGSLQSHTITVMSSSCICLHVSNNDSLHVRDQRKFAPRAISDVPDPATQRYRNPLRHVIQPKAPGQMRNTESPDCEQRYPHSANGTSMSHWNQGHVSTSFGASTTKMAVPQTFRKD